MVERTHCQLKDPHKLRLVGSVWPNHLPWVLLGLRSVPKEDTAISVTEMVHGAPLSLPAQLAADLETQHLVDKLQTSATFLVRHSHLVSPADLLPALVPAEMVYVRLGSSLRLLMPLYSSPY